MHAYTLLNVTASTESFQGFLQGGSRVLLMIAMALFLAYMLFFLSTMSIAGAITTWHHVRPRPGQVAHPRELSPVVSASEVPHQALPATAVRRHGRRALRTEA